MTCSTKLFLMSITVLIVWLQFSQAYCVYNHLDGTDSYLYIKERDANPRVSFKKQINKGQKECCPWDSGDCNPSARRKGTVDFHITFGLFGASLEGATTYFASCSGGGGLAFTGNSLSSITATCNHADGSVESRTVTPL